MFEYGSDKRSFNSVQNYTTLKQMETPSGKQNSFNSVQNYTTLKL